MVNTDHSYVMVVVEVVVVLLLFYAQEHPHKNQSQKIFMMPGKEIELNL